MPTTQTRVVSELRTITPADAEAMLAKNTRNRGVSRKRVEQYARALIAGEWEVNGEAIKFAHDGTLIDGQHRILAILEADEPMTTLVITGLSPHAQETIDTGRGRTFGDMLKLRGETHYTGVAAATRALFFYTAHGRPDRWGGDAPSAQELFGTLADHPQIRDAVYTIGSQTTKVKFIGQNGTLATLLYLFRAVDSDDADTFLMSLLTGADLNADNPIYRLRERLLRDVQVAGGANRMRPIVKSALIVKTFNLWRAGERVQALSWRPGGVGAERFPLVEGCPYNPSF